MTKASKYTNIVLTEQNLKERLLTTLNLHLKKQKIKFKILKISTREKKSLFMENLLIILNSKDITLFLNRINSTFTNQIQRNSSGKAVISK
jgi:hypothetical protein